MDDLKENGFESGKKISYDNKNAQNNRAVSGQIARKLVGDSVNPLQAAKMGVKVPESVVLQAAKIVE
jgi:hypothetical protein